MINTMHSGNTYVSVVVSVIFNLKVHFDEPFNSRLTQCEQNKDIASTSVDMFSIGSKENILAL